MGIQYICDNCDKVTLPHQLTSLMPVVDKYLCPECFAKLKAILDNFWGDKK